MNQTMSQHMKALVVDDDGLIRSNVAEVLSGDGWKVAEADSAEQALELLHREPWSLVFCDVRLSAKNNHEGYDVLRRFNDERPDAQIILMTGHGSAVGALDAVSSAGSQAIGTPDVRPALSRAERTPARAGTGPRTSTDPASTTPATSSLPGAVPGARPRRSSSTRGMRLPCHLPAGTGREARARR